MYYGGRLLVDGQQVDAIVIPDGVTKICARAFYFCGYINKIVIPVSVTSIGDGALDFYVDYLEITYRGTMVQWNAIDKPDDWAQYSYTVICTNGVINN